MPRGISGSRSSLCKLVLEPLHLAEVLAVRGLGEDDESALLQSLLGVAADTAPSLLALWASM